MHSSIVVGGYVCLSTEIELRAYAVQPCQPLLGYKAKKGYFQVLPSSELCALKGPL